MWVQSSHLRAAETVGHAKLEAYRREADVRRMLRERRGGEKAWPRVLAAAVAWLRAALRPARA